MSAYGRLGDWGYTAPMTSFSRVLLAGGALLLLAGTNPLARQVPPAAAARSPVGLLRRDALPHDRAVPRRPDEGGGRHPRPAERLLHRRLQRRRVEDDRLRPHVDADLRRPADRVDRRDRGRAVEPDIIYVGSGEGLQRPDLSTGDGIYKSTDAGRTWTHLGLRDGQQIPQIAVDPREPRPAVRGRARPSLRPERGARRSSARSTAARPSSRCSTGTTTPAPSTWCSIRRTRTSSTRRSGRRGQGRGRTAGSPARAAASTSRRTAARRGGALDRGAARPSRRDGLGRIGLAVAPSNPRRVFATVEAERRGGLYRSDDAGEHWTLVHDDRVRDRARRRLRRGQGRSARTPTSCISASIVAWKSVDGGRTFSALRGAPGGDDYHRIWINPSNPTSSCSRPTRAPSSR